MPASCSRQAEAITTSASRALIAWSATIAGATPRRSSSRKIRSATFSTIWTCTHEWSDIPSRVAFVCWTSHQALSWSSALAASSSAWSLRLPRAGARSRISAVPSRGVSATNQPLEQVAGLARVDAVLALVAARLLLVGEGEDELLARGAEVAGDLGERDERRVLHDAGHARSLRKRPVAARGRDLDGGGGDDHVGEDVSKRHRGRRDRDPLERPAPRVAGQDRDGGAGRQQRRDDEGEAERLRHRLGEGLVRARAEPVVLGALLAGEGGAAVVDR